MADVTLDARGLKCPLPILKARRALNKTPPDGLLEVLATDPLASADFEDFCRVTGNELVESSAEGDVFRFLIRRREA